MRNAILIFVLSLCGSAMGAESLYHIASGSTYHTVGTKRMPDSLYTNCVLWLTMDEDPARLSTWTVEDFSGRKNDGTQTTATNRPTFATKTLSFDGVTDYVSCGGSASLTAASGTMSAWVRPNLAPAAGIKVALSTTDAGNVAAVQIYIGVDNIVSTNFPIFVVRDASLTRWYHTGNGIIASNSWALVTLTQSGTAAPVLYLNGATQSLTKVGTADESAGYWWDNMTIDAITVGDRWVNTAPPSLPFLGCIDDVMIFNRALTAAEVLTLYNATANPTPARP